MSANKRKGLLTVCLKKAKPYIPPDLEFSILAQYRQNRTNGTPNYEAGVNSLRSHLDEVRAQIKAEQEIAAPTGADAIRMGLGEFNDQAKTLYSMPGGSWVLLDERNADNDKPQFTVAFSLGGGKWGTGENHNTIDAAYQSALTTWTNRGGKPQDFKQADKTAFVSGTQGPDLFAPKAENNATTAPDRPAIYKLANGVFARYQDGIWYRGEQTPQKALKTEMTSSELKPKDRFDDQAWTFYAEFTLDKYGATKSLKQPVADKAKTDKEKASQSSEQDQAPALVAPTRDEVVAKQEREEQAKKAETDKRRSDEEKARKEEDRKRIAQASQAAADTFVLGGNAMDNLTGQKDIFGAMEDAAPVAEAKADKDKESEQGGMFARGAQTAPQFYSQLQRAIEQVPDRLATMPAQQWKLWLDSNGPKLGVKKDEIELSGIKDYLDLRGKDKVTRDELVAYLADSGVRVTETVMGGTPEKPWAYQDGINGNYEWFSTKQEAEDFLQNQIDEARENAEAIGEEPMGDDEVGVIVNYKDVDEDNQDNPTKYAQYTQPGGENYREVLITLPVRPRQVTPKEQALKDKKDFAELAAMQKRGEIAPPQPAPYKSSHWDEPNVLVHLRVNDRTDADGKRVLFVEELQSDWGQEGKKRGWFTPETRAFRENVKKALAAGETPTPEQQPLIDAALKAVDAPFVTKTESWLNLALKRVMMMAVDGGYDKVAFVTGEQSAERYDLSKQVRRVEWVGQRDGSKNISIAPIDGNDIEFRVMPDGTTESMSGGLSGNEFTGKRLDDVVGKEMAEKIMRDRDGSLSGDGLKVGGEGMKAFYDQIVPQAANALLKKVGGGKVETVRFEEKRAFEFDDGLNLSVPVTSAKSAPITQPGFTITDAMRETVGQGLPLFARDRLAEAPTPPANRLQMPVSDVQKAIDQIAAKWTNGPKIVVVKMPSDLPRPAPSDARGLLYGDTAYIVASNHANQAGVQRTLAHEAIGHYGLWKMLGTDGTRKFQKNLQLALKSGNKPLNELSQKVRKLYVDKNGKFNLSPEDEANEIAAFAVEAALDADGNFKPGFGFMKEVYAKIAQFLRDLGINIQFTNSELQGMLVAATRGMEAGKRLDGGQGVVNAYARAWHGTPHRFDKFTTDKMGTGEGAQAYGWGLYFASKKDIAEHYRKNLQTTTRGGLFYKGNPLTASTMNKLALNGSPAEQSVFSAKWPSKNIETEMEKRALQYEADAIEKAKQNSAISKEWAAEYTRRAATIRSVMADIERRADRENGQLYEVEIPEDSEMLLWDKPLSEQPEAVRRALADADAEWAKQISGKKVPDFVSAFWPGNGSELYKQLSNRLSRYKKADFGDPKADRFASEYLASLGIKGIKYLDGTSRSAGEGSYNYVIFSGDDVEIQKAYYARGKFKGWPKSSNWTRQEYNDVVSLLPSAYRNHSHRREPLPANYRDSLPAGALQELASYGSIFSLDDLGNIQVDGQTATKEDYANAKAMADKYGLGVFATNVKRDAMQQLHDDGFVGEMGMAMVLMRETGSSRAPMATPSENRYTKDAYSFGTMMAYKPRGFSPPTMFARGADDAMANQSGIPAGDGATDADKYQMAGPIVDGREVRKDVPNMSSIASSLDDYTVLKGVREVPMSDFALTGKSYSVSETKRIENLAEQIKESGEINPMIVVIDRDGPYILEGAHRSEALFKLGAKSFPAVVVLDNESLNKSAAPDSGGAFARGNTKQTETPAFIDVDGKQRPTTNNLGQAIYPTEDGIRNFWRWFGDSKVVDADGRPLVVYHGTKGDFSEFEVGRETENSGAFGNYKESRLGLFFAEDSKLSDTFAAQGDKKQPGSNVMPVYLRVKKPLDLTEGFQGLHSDDFNKLFDSFLKDNYWAVNLNPDDIWSMLDKGTVGATEFVNAAKVAGFDGVKIIERDAQSEATNVWVAFNPTQIKSAIGNNGDFGLSNPNIAFARGGNLFQQPTWVMPGESNLDKAIYEGQDGRIDLKRAQQAIEKSGQKIEEKWDARLAETLYPGRVAHRSKQFLKAEVQPLLKALATYQVPMNELADYLHARHAPEANKSIAARNDGLPDGGAGKNTKGVLMTNQAAKDYLAAITPGRQKILDALARRVDAITAGTRSLWVTEGLAKKSDIDAMEAAFKHYVPLFREDAESDLPAHPIGSGFSVKGKETKQRIGSTKEVTNILAHVLMQREVAITRAEKNRVALSLYGMALSHPNPKFWTTIRPNMTAAKIGAELQSMGVDPATAIVGMERAPTITAVDPNTGKVVNRPNPMYKGLLGAIPLKINGEDRVLMINARDERGLRMAENLKNLDGLTKLDLANTIVGKSTRWLASVNTQYNPAFGLVNLTRDTLGAAVNLGSTGLRGDALKVLAKTPLAIAGIARELASGNQTGKWQTLYRQFQEDGGQTGFKDNFRDAGDRAKAIEAELKALGRAKLDPRRGANMMLELLDGFNTTLENAVRLSAYSAALDKGMSRAESARLGRELTVDFNRKGRMGREAGPLYAFFNASVQGSARTIQTLAGPTGAKVIAGGLGLGVLQALMLAAAGYEDDELPEWVKTRALIIPMFDAEKSYVAIPYPLGLHVIPNTGRVMAELALNGGKDIGKRTVGAIGELAGAFNPLGGGNIFTADGALKTVAPTVVDPIIEMGFNKNFAGGTIEKQIYGGESDNRPGAARAKEGTLRSTTGQAYLGISKAINSLTGGTDYEAGKLSPTPERLRYIAQTVGGGLLREIENSINASTAEQYGKEVAPNKIPVLGRFYGEVDAEQNIQRRYYETANDLKKMEGSLKAMKKAGDFEAADAFKAENPELKLIRKYHRLQSSITKLNKEAVQVVNDPTEAAAIDQKRLELMGKLNDALKELEQETEKPNMGDKIKEATKGWRRE